MTSVQQILAGNIRKARGKLQYSQMKLAELCDVSTSFIGEIELGKKFPSALTLERIAAALGLRPFQLFLEEEDWAAFERYEVLTSLSLELKEKLNEELTNTFRKYLGGRRVQPDRAPVERGGAQPDATSPKRAPSELTKAPKSARKRR